jgi:hypothetical protein
VTLSATSQAVLRQPEPEDSGSADELVLEVELRVVQRRFLLLLRSAEEKKCSWPHLRVVAEVLAGPKRQNTTACPLLPVKSSSHPDDVIRLSFRVFIFAGDNLSILDLETFLFDILQERADLVQHQISSLVVKGPKRTLDQGIFTDNVKTLSGLEDGKSTGKVTTITFQLLDMILDVFVELDCLPDGDLETFRSAAVSSISQNPDLQNRYLAHHSSLLAPYLPELPGRPVVEPIDLIDSLQTPLLNHELSPMQRAFFRWLEEQSDPPVTGNAAAFLEKERHEANQAGHVTIVTAHVSCSPMFGFIG